MASPVDEEDWSLSNVITVASNEAIFMEAYIGSAVDVRDHGAPLKNAGVQGCMAGRERRLR
jgi:hypothetical protein